MCFVTLKLPVDNEDKLHPIGQDTYIQFYIDDNSKVIGLIEWHKNTKTDEWCGGSVLFDFADAKYKKKFDGEYATWHVESKIGEPLTVTPSIACGGCEHHGYITDGRWQPC